MAEGNHGCADEGCGLRSPRIWERNPIDMRRGWRRIIQLCIRWRGNELSGNVCVI